MENITIMPLQKYWKIFTVMFRIGLFTFGGGLAMLPQMSRDFVERRGWINESDIVDIFAVAQSLPGVVAINTSVLVGYRIARLPGAIIAAVGSTLPSLLVLSLVTVVYDAFVTNPYVGGALIGIRAAVTGILLTTVLKLAYKPLQNVWGVCLFLAALALSLFTDINVIWILLGAMLTGLLRYFWNRNRKTGSVS